MSKIRAGFHIKKPKWEKFKSHCEDQGSNASTEIRRFINLYNKYHSSEKISSKNDFFAKIQLEK